ncbi:MAG: rod shape-determining protein MreC [Bacteroidia bacterium]|nr:rod shape-determining protein MreC [Bacteroidia bacterium]
MQRLLDLLSRYGSVVYFLVLQFVGLRLLVDRSPLHGELYGQSALGLAGRLEAVEQGLSSHFTRSEQNRQLQQENQVLHTQLEALKQRLATYQYQVPYLPGKSPLPDSLLPAVDYRFIPCRAVGNSVQGNYNYLILNIGRKHGVKPEMGVISASGVAGMVVDCTEDFSRAISVLNKDFRLSGRVRHRGVYGSFGWDGRSAERGQLEHIPLHFQILPGDTVEASGYSTLFPEGTLVGTVVRVVPDEVSGFQDIEVALSTDFNKLDYLYLVEALHKPQLDSLSLRAREGS